MQRLSKLAFDTKMGNVSKRSISHHPAMTINENEFLLTGSLAPSNHLSAVIEGSPEAVSGNSSG